MKVYELLDSPEKWIKYDMARDGYGSLVAACDKSAVCWCLLGALQKCYLIKDSVCGYFDSIHKLSSVLDPGVIGADFIVIFNDNPNTTYENIIKICKELDL